jgi:hypothetical protein
MTTLRRILLSAGLVISVAGIASADSITNVFYYTPQSPIGVVTASSCDPSTGNLTCVTSIPNSSQNHAFFTVGGFIVPEGATLNDVVYTFDGISNSALTITNNNSGSISVSGSYNLAFFSLGPQLTNPNSDGSGPYQISDFGNNEGVRTQQC